jgi:adenylate kinase family enzyme
MHRILVIGCSGTGKSTLSRVMGQKLGLPVVHLDREFWLPGWVEPDAAAWRARVEALVAGDAWIMDGNYGGTLAVRLPRAEAIVWLDLPRYVYFPRAAFRSLKGYGRVRPDSAPGCPERFDMRFLLRWVWSYPTRGRPRTLALLETIRHQKPVIVLRSTREVRSFAEGLPETLRSEPR